MSGPISTDKGRLLGAWRRSGFQELWLQFGPSVTDDVGRDVQRAILAANEATQAAGHGDDVFGTGLSSSPRGHVVYLSRAFSPEAITAWLAAFAAQLEEAGVGGTIKPALPAHFPMWLRGTVQHPFQLTGLVSYAIVDNPAVLPEAHPDWQVDREVTRRIADAAVSWGGFDGAETYFRSNLFQTRTAPDVALPLAESVRRFGMAGVTYVRAKPTRIAAITFAPEGRAAFQLWDEESGWEERLTEVIRAIVALPAETDVALIQYTPPLSLAWSGIDAGPLRLLAVEEYQVRYNKHLDRLFVPDVRGVQVLTDAHLEKAADLTRWRVDDLGGGRHLVQAVDLAAWYAHPLPHPDVLAQGREDFGAMILTPEAIEAHPHHRPG
jgi:hypothetical protein